jgi:hypothetical protein
MHPSLLVRPEPIPSPDEINETRQGGSTALS